MKPTVGVIVSVICGAALVSGAAAAGAEVVKGSVTPGSGGPGASFTLTYPTPIATGIVGKTVTYEEVQVIDKNTATYESESCASSFDIDPAYGAAAGARESLELHPGRPWCAGPYLIQVLELKAPSCWAEQTCKATVFREIGTFTVSASFRIT